MTFINAQAQSPPAQAATPAAAEQTASELLSTGEKAYNAGQWDLAADAFNTFITQYQGIEGTAEAVARVKRLLAICWTRLEQFDAAMPLFEEVLKQEGIEKKQRADLLFFASLAKIRSGKAAEARELLGQLFNDPTVERSRRMEALVLGGNSYVIEQKWAEAIDFFQKYTDEIVAFSSEAGARARMMWLHALMQEKRRKEAIDLALKMHQDVDQMRQLATFSLLLIELGSQAIDAEEYYEAIRVLRLVPTAAEIKELQAFRIAEAESDFTTATNTRMQVRASQIQSSLAEMKLELEQFEKIPQFDSASRMRLATAYYQLDRTREACLILDQMVRQMPPDALVEAACSALIRGWMTLERYPRAVRTADLYQERLINLTEKPNMPDVLFLRAQALEGQFLHAEAATAFREVAAKFPALPIAAKAKFMAAYNVLMLEDYQAAAKDFDEQLKSLKPSDEMWPHVIFWRGMASYFDQQWEPAREIFARYQEQAKSSENNQEYLDDASFRIAYSHFSEANYTEAIKLLEKFEKAFPESEWLSEALLALGDSYGAEGLLDKADQAYARIGVEAPGFHDEGWFKRGNILKMQKDTAGMNVHYENFLSKRRDSPRVPEAIYWLGWVAKQKGDRAAAQEIYWQAIRRFGNDPPRPGVEDLFVSLLDSYPDSDKIQLEEKLNELATQAKTTLQKRLAVRSRWALAMFYLDHPFFPAELRANKSRDMLADLAPDVVPDETSPKILADVADALMERGELPAARTMYENVRKWWPRAPERDRAFAGLGFLAQRAGQPEVALTAFDRFEKMAVMPKSAPDANGVSLVESELGAKVALARADLLSNSSPEKALHVLLALQKSKAMPAKTRAQALMAAARMHVSRSQFREALPYFEQIYLLYNRFPDLVADAYFERGQALEKLKMNDQAREVYSELANRADLQEMAPAKSARARAEALGGVIPPAAPEGEMIAPTSSTR